jgi:hypothetical protein
MTFRSRYALLGSGNFVTDSLWPRLPEIGVFSAQFRETYFIEMPSFSTQGCFMRFAEWYVFLEIGKQFPRGSALSSAFAGRTDLSLGLC